MSDNNFKVMDDREYMLHRPEIFIGSMSECEHFGIYNYKYQKKIYVPSLVKIIEEIIDNGVDEAIRTNFKHANKITVSITEDMIRGWTVTVTDNGRGIPIVMHDGKYQAELAWTKPRAGSNFNDDGRTTIGRNGVGSACTNYFSTSFLGISGNGKECVTVSTYENCSEITTTIGKCDDKHKGTIVKFAPDLKRFGLSDISQDTLDIIEDRLCNLSICYPEIDFYFNDKKIQNNNISQLVSNFPNKSFGQYDENYTLVISPSGDDEEFRHLSYFNGICIKKGGNHIDYMIKGICDELIPMIEKKWKVSVLPNQIKQHLMLSIWVRGYENLKFDSQTKERVTNTIGEIKSFLNIDFSRLASKILSNESIIMPMIEAIIRKKEAIEKRAITNAQKKAKKKKIADHIVANSNDPYEKTLFITEGQCVDSNSPIFTSDGAKKIKDVRIGDFVFTHKHRMRKVVSTSQSLKKGILLNGRIYSHDHRLYVYNKEHDQFCFVKVKDLQKGIHCLVKNKLIEQSLHRSLHIVEHIFNNVVYFKGNYSFEFSDTHEILVFVHGEVTMKTISDICVDDTIII